MLLSFYFNPLPSCEGRREGLHNGAACLNISIHSPHARGDVKDEFSNRFRHTFQSTPLMRGETPYAQITAYDSSDFNPLPSCEGRHGATTTTIMQDHFNPLPSCEGRRVTASPPSSTMDFNPLPSCEGRHQSGCQRARLRSFQSTPLMRGETA